MKHATSAASLSIRAIPTLCSWQPWVTALDQTRSEAFTDPRTVDARGRKFCSRTTLREPWICALNPATLELCSRRCGTGFESRDRRELRLGQAAGSINQPTKGLRGRKSQGMVFPRETGADPALLLRLAFTGNGFT